MVRAFGAIDKVICQAENVLGSGITWQKISN
jgi:hypothetical protein